MKTLQCPVSSVDSWVPLPAAARCLGISPEVMHLWGKAGKFGYRQLSPKRFEVCLSEVIAYYTERFPRIVINHELIEILMQSTA